MIDIGSKLAEWRDHPAQMCEDVFGIVPDPWQAEVLEAFPTSPRIAMMACTGPGKTLVLGVLGWNYLLTRPHPHVAVTSISGDNLKSGLWTELARLGNRSPLLGRIFEQQKTMIFAKEHPGTWKLEARSWAKDANPEQIGAALRGVHAEYVMWLLDETGDYPPAILPVVEAIFSGEPKEAHVVQAGNPINRQGPLYHAHTHRDTWKVVNITADPNDPNRTPRVSVEHAQQQINEWGRENPWILINIFGQFPPSSMNALIGPEEVEKAMKRYYRPYEIGDAPKVLGVDVARMGDDASVIFPRQGIQAFKMLRYRNVDSTQGAGQVVRKWDEWEADGVFIDDTGGFGSGWIDNLIRLGKSPIGVHFAGNAHEHGRYYNKRAEMYFDAVAWIKRGGALPESRELMRALTETTYTHKNDKLILEPKEIVKEKLGFSPDEADAFVLTFAEPVTALGRSVAQVQPPQDYKPFAELDRVVQASYGNKSAADNRYDPYRSRVD
jgi:phage terminase large subunit